MINFITPIIYLILSVAQFFAIVTYFSTVQDINSFLSVILALITCGIPVIGTILGVLGAHGGWGWGWGASILLFLSPLILVIIFSILGRNRI